MDGADTTQETQPSSPEQSPFSEADYKCTNEELLDLIGSPWAPSENENSGTEKDLDDALEKGEFLSIEENVTANSLTSCKMNALLKSFEVNKKLKDKAESLGPEQEEFEQLANLVGEFSKALIDPLKSDDDKRRSFEGCFDMVLQKAIQWDQKKFIAHPVVNNLLQSMWYGPFLKLRKSPWSKSGYWGFVLLTILTLLDIVLFPFLFAFLFIIRLSNTYRRKRKAMEISFDLVLKDTEDFTATLIERSICYLIQQYGYQEGDYRDTQRQDDGTNNGISLSTFVNNNDMKVTRIAATTSGNRVPEREKRVVLFNDVTSEHRKKLQEILRQEPGIVTVCVGKNVRMKELTEFESLYFEDYVAPSTVGKAIIQKLEGKDVFEHYMSYFTIPWFIFVRDTLSYFTLLSLHFVICLLPPTVAFSNIEWVVFMFFLGRILMEVDQFVDVSNEKEKANKRKNAQRSQYQSVSRIDEEAEKESNAKESNAKQFVRNFQDYFSDHWNRLDFVILIVYVITFILRMIAWGKSEPILGNPFLAAAHSFYGLNALLLTLRAIGHVMERVRGMGAILIALFRIVKDVGAIFCQFIATIIGFSIAITSVYVAEQSYDPNANPTDEELVCSAPGLECWWSVMLHLCWSLLGLADRDLLKSASGTTLSLVYLLYGLFLIIAVILLVNMMIALLSNTYQRVEDNALKEWSFKKAVSVKTYSLYHPVPVPFNLLSIPAVYLFQYWRRCRCRGHQDDEDGVHQDGINQKRKEDALDDLIEKLEPTYFATYGYSFPLTGEGKMDQLLHEIHGNRGIANHISRGVFRERGLGQRSLEAGPIAWESQGIEIEGSQLSCTGIEDSRRYGARYKTPFSREMPRMELLILEGGERRAVGIGAVFKDYKFWWMPGWHENSVGYHADHGTIFDDKNSDKGRKVVDAMAYRGDLMACEVDFSKETEMSVPILFYLNGRQVGSATVKYTTGQRELFPYIGMGYKGIRVLTKMCPRRGSPSPIEEFHSDGTKEEIRKTIQAQFKVIEDKWRKETERMLQTMHEERKKEMEEIKNLLKEYGQRSEEK